MALFASGNHLIWIRPSFQDSIAHNIAAGKKITQGQRAVDALKWGDENQLPEPSTWFSIAVDRGQSFWIARHNAPACRKFMFVITGTAKQNGSDLQIFGRNNDEPFLVMMNYQYALQAAARVMGDASNGPIYDNEDRFANKTLVLKGYRRRSRYVRQLDASMMTPDERLCEMTQCAIEDPNFSRDMKAQFGMLADPIVLFQMALIMGVFVGIGAGAEFLGGAAFAAALMKLCGVAMVAHQASGYVKAFEDLKKSVFSDKQDDFVNGVKIVQKVLIMALTDIAMFVTMEGAIKIGTKALSVLKRLFTQVAPEDWLKAAKEAEGKMRHKVAQARASRYGYVGEQILKRVPNINKLFRKAELDHYLNRAAKNQEMVVIRGPSAERMEWLTKLRGWLDGKSEWIKAKSWMGWKVGGRPTGLVGVPKQALNEALAKAGLKLTPTSPYPMGNLRGVFAEVDNYISSLAAGKTTKGQPYAATRPSYEIPIGVDVKVDVPGKGEMGVFEWGAARKNGADARGCRLVDVGDTYIIVDSLGRPICQDLDLGALQKLHSPEGSGTGTHLPSGRVNPEDNFEAQELANWKMGRASGDMYSPEKHSGGGGSGRHIFETKQANAAIEQETASMKAAGQQGPFQAQRKHWKPRDKHGAYEAEDLYVFLPIAGGGSEVFKVEGWAQLEEFWRANEKLFGSKWVF